MSHCHRCPKKCNHFRSLELSSHYCQLYWLDAVHLQCAGHPKNMFLTWHHLRLSLMITLTTAWAWRCDGDYAAEHLMVRVCLSPSHCQPPTPPPPPPPPPPAPSLSPPVLCWPVRAWPPPFLTFQYFFITRFSNFSKYLGVLLFTIWDPNPRKGYTRRSLRHSASPWQGKASF